MAEIKSLKSLVEALETENEKLRQHLAMVYETGSGEMDGFAKAGGQLQSGKKTLEKLYEEGFHICNIHFGQARAGECLFCAAFLRRERE